MYLSSGAIRHPRNDPFIIRRLWAITACEHPDAKNPEYKKRDGLAETSAELLAIFEYHYTNRYANDLLQGLINNATKRHGKRLRDFGYWQCYSIRYLRELLLGGRGKEQIENALEHLVKLKFISNNVPKDIADFYSSNFTWYKLEVENIQIWIDTNIEMMIPFEHKDITFVNEKDEVVAVHTEEEKPDKGITAIIKAICGFHRHIHNKNDRYVYDNKRMAVVKARLKEKRTLGELAQVIIANVLDDFYQGNSPNNDARKGGRVLDSIEYMFREARAFERHLEIADKHGITEEIALSEFQAFLDKKPSKYAKRRGKQAVNGANGEHGHNVARKVYPKEVIQHYSKFALAVAPMFARPNKLSSIMELAMIELEKEGKGLTDANLLNEIILDKMNLFLSGVGNIDTETKTRIRDFANAYAEYQESNAEE